MTDHTNDQFAPEDPEVTADEAVAAGSEGVETTEQLGMLRWLGCDEMQGYYFSHPVPAERILSLLDTQWLLRV